MKRKMIDRFNRSDYSKMMVADYKPNVSVDGEGWRCSLYVSGCLFNCKGCYNKSIQDFNAGYPYSSELEDKIISDLKPNYIQGFTLLGGEPMLNTDIGLSITNRIRDEFNHDKDIWCWTGYTWEDLLESISCDTLNSRKQAHLLNNIDVLVDGPYMEEMEGWSTGKIKFRGSYNQRIIDVQASLKSNELIELTNYYE